MRRYLIPVAFIAQATFSPDHAYACMTQAPLNPIHIEHADVVVTGRIANFRIVRHTAAGGNLYDDHAQFDLVVDEVLRGSAGTTLSVEWHNSTFALPRSMEPGPFLIALRRAGSGPFRATPIITAERRPGSWAVLQTPCAPPFIFDSTSAQADAIRKQLAERPRYQTSANGGKRTSTLRPTVLSAPSTARPSIR